MEDTRSLARRLKKPKLTGVSRHQGVVQAVNGDGTANITIDGSTKVKNSVYALTSVALEEDDTVEILQDGNDLFIIGKLGPSAGGGSGGGDLTAQPVATHSWNGGSTSTITATTEATRQTLMQETIPDTANRSIEAVFDCSGYVYSSGTVEGTALLQIEYSADGGSTWEFLNSNRQLLEKRSIHLFSAFSLLGRYEGIPSSDLLVRVTGYTWQGNNLAFHGSNTELVAQVFSTGSVVLDNRYVLKNQNNWNALNLSSDYEPFGGNWSAPSYRLTLDGQVRLRGLLRRISGTGTGTVATLPASLVPTGNEIHAIRVAGPPGGSGRLDVQSNGELVLNVGSNGGDDVTATSGWVSLSGVTFDIH